MPNEIDATRLDAARCASDALAEEHGNPRDVETNMHILARALMDLGVIEFTQHQREKFGLRSVLQKFVVEGLIDRSAVTCCSGMEELIQVADYDITDEDQFAEDIASEIGVLQEELDNAFNRFEAQVADENGE
jgi:hypothetical protein